MGFCKTFLVCRRACVPCCIVCDHWITFTGIACTNILDGQIELNWLEIRLELIIYDCHASDGGGCICRRFIFDLLFVDVRFLLVTWRFWRDLVFLLVFGLSVGAWWFWWNILLLSWILWRFEDSVSFYCEDKMMKFFEFVLSFGYFILGWFYRWKLVVLLGFCLELLFYFDCCFS